ncbi:MAG TPA: hypothetical protein VGN26_22635 [Armatimonadota bacterium]|jgi:hypothetical protein
MADELRRSEYEALRRELEATSRRVYDTVAFAITVAAAVLGYGFRSDSLWTTLVPVPLVCGAYALVVQSVRSQRRVSAYLQFWHESVPRGAVWERMLVQQRLVTRSRKRAPQRSLGWAGARTSRLMMAAQFQLLWVFGALSVASSWVVGGPTLQTPQLYIRILAACFWVVMYLVMRAANEKLRGGGLVEQEFLADLQLAGDLIGAGDALGAQEHAG